MWGSSSMAVRITPLLCKRLQVSVPRPRHPSTASGKKATSATSGQHKDAASRQQAVSPV